MCKFRFVFSYDKYCFLKSRQSRQSSTLPILNQRLVYINEIYMDCRNSEMNDKYLFYLPTLILWHKITSLTIHDPSDLYQLRLLVSKMINLRTLELCYHFNYSSDANSNKQNLIDLLNDTSLCNILMSNGLQKLNLDTNGKYPDMIENIASLIVKQLPHLQIIELRLHDSQNIQVPEGLHILINGLPKLNFLIFHGSLRGGNEQHSKMRDLWKNSTRAYRMECYNPLIIIGASILYLWLY